MTVNKKTKIKIAAVLILAVVVALLAWFLLTGENLEIIKSVFTADLSKGEVQDTLRTLGTRGHITISVLSMLQVILMFLPAEPVQVLAGVSFGLWVGFAACLVGVVLGNTLIYVLYRVYGDRLGEYFDRKLDIRLEEHGNSKLLMLAVFMLYFLPAIPYGMICFLASTTRMKYFRYLLVTTIGAAPSVIIGVGLGHMAMNTSWILSIAVFVLLLAALAVVMAKRELIMKKVNEFLKKRAEPHSSSVSVKPYSRHKLLLPYIVSKFIFFGKVKCKYNNKVGKVDTPSIVLCNHGSFIDFAYAGTILRRQSPNFVVARLYFYHRFVKSVLEKVGCFPKSMFTMDIESAKNCIKVIKSGGVLAMMPEARLSTVGRFEDIQDGTYSFLKQCGVTVYSLKMSGDYFAKPKWGKGLRRGSLVEAELDVLFAADELKALDEAEIKARVEERLNYNEFEWLELHPEIHYKSKKLAEGLENILSKCPECKQKYTLTTKNNEIRCSCGLHATVDGRYGFVNSYPFKNFAEWYGWQTEEYRREISSAEDFALTSPVTLMQPSKDGKTMLEEAGRGVCVLDRGGLTYRGTLYGENVEKHFPQEKIWRLLFGAGENFEIYENKVIWYFKPDEPKSAVDFYIVSGLLKEI